MDDPQSFGVCELDERGEIVDIVEKPENPKSNLAIGEYIFSIVVFGSISTVRQGFR